MALKLYNPRTKAYVTYAPAEYDLSPTELFLLNILIETKAQTHYLASINQAVMENNRPGNQFEDPGNVLADIVSVT